MDKKTLEKRIWDAMIEFEDIHFYSAKELFTVRHFIEMFLNGLDENLNKLQRDTPSINDFL